MTLWIAALILGYALANFDTLRLIYAPSWHGFRGGTRILYELLYALSGVSLGLLLVAVPRFLACGVVLLGLVVATTNAVAVDLLDLKVLNKESAEWLLSESRVAPAAIGEFSGAVLRHLASCCAFLLPFLVAVYLGRRHLLRHLWGPVPLALGALAAYGLIDLTLYHYFKPFIPVESNLAIYAADLTLRGSPDIPPLDLKPPHPPLASKVLLVVDETLTYGGYVAQLRAPWAKWPSVDYGEAASLANCSAASNSMLRWGFRAPHMLAAEDPRLVPTIWSYARGAGFATYLIDGQRNGSYQNFMRNKEAALIDHYPGVERGMDTDQAIATLLNTLLLKPGKSFIYVNKRGNHFPYANNFPRDQFPDARSREQQYAAAIRYSSRDFLETMLRGVSLADVLVLYTSDHGERFDGAGTPHCSTAPVWQEFSVPLLLLTGNQPLAQQAQAAATALRDHASHEQIFATLLAAMGYDARAAEALYGSSLLSAAIPARYFHVLVNPIASKGGGAAVREFAHFPYRGP